MNFEFWYYFPFYYHYFSCLLLFFYYYLNSVACIWALYLYKTKRKKIVNWIKPLNLGACFSLGKRTECTKTQQIYWMCVTYSIDIAYQVVLCVFCFGVCTWWYIWCTFHAIRSLSLSLYIFLNCLGVWFTFAHTSFNRYNVWHKEEAFDVKKKTYRTISCPSSQTYYIYIFICKPIDIWSLIDIAWLHVCPFICVPKRH